MRRIQSLSGRRTGQLLKGVVEADEAFVGGSRSGGRWGAPNKSIVVVMVEQREHTAGSAALEIVPDASWESLGPTVRGLIEGANTTIVTDGHRGDSPLQSAGVGHEATTLVTPEAAREVLPRRRIASSSTWGCSSPVKSWPFASSSTFRLCAGPRFAQRSMASLPAAKASGG
ncbi:MAG: transposase [bacterium]|nr:transposase [bacterium]